MKEVVEKGEEVYYEDESKKYLTTIVRKVIARVNSKPSIKVNISKKGVFIHAAISVRSKEVVINITERSNSKTAMQLLYKIKRQRSPGRMYMVWDNNGHHLSKVVKYLARKKGIHFIQMPPYSPELNPVEEIWRQLKEYLKNRLFFKIEELVAAIEEFFCTRGYKFEINILSYFDDIEGKNPGVLALLDNQDVEVDFISAYNREHFIYPLRC